MENVHYRRMEAADREVVAGMIMAFYEEAGGGEFMNPGMIERTFRQLAAHPDYGWVVLFEAESRILGYALLINFWSNEYGGIVLNIDELYVVPAARGGGVGTAFLDHLAAGHLGDFVALKLEVLPYNRRAMRLYEKLGFEKSDRDFLIRPASGAGQQGVAGA
jgi:GNAT superfamily N-acetyltransferase